jgi:hypothetical protein
MRWHERLVRPPFAGQHRIVVPLWGGPPPEDASRLVAEFLQRRWLSGTSPLDIADVVATITADARRPISYSLHLLVTASGPTDRRIDAPPMARDLAAALAAACSSTAR